MNTLGAVLSVIGVVLLVCAVLRAVYVPLSIWFVVLGHMNGQRPRSGRRGRYTPKHEPQPEYLGEMVSVIVPAYNESVVLVNCVESILRSNYPHLEVILVDDGSTDDTFAIMSGLARRHGNVVAVHQQNSGKGAALNTGIGHARGNFLMFVDADGLFCRDTVEWLLLSFAGDDVGAVCGDDRPANPDRTLTRLLSIMSHLGTGMVRRSLSLLHCLPIVSGNIGAFRADVVKAIDGFDEHTLGEDLELTWRIYDAGYRVSFQPRAIVYAESPSTLRGLWRQRVRWARGLLQTSWSHRTLIGNPRLGTFGVFLAFNTVTMILSPVLQLVLFVGVLAMIPFGVNLVGAGVVAAFWWLGMASSLALVLLAIGLNGAWRDLRYLWTVVLWPAYSVFMCLVMVAALTRELQRSPSSWNKLERTGVVTQGVAAQLGASPAERAA